MAMDRYAVIKVAGTEPEQFFIAWLDSQLPKGSFMKTGEPMPEAEMREELRKMGISKTDSDGLIQKARDNPR